MIVTLTFPPGLGRVRSARFVPRAGLSIDAACDLASGVCTALRGILGDACVVSVGEPVALDTGIWEALSRDAIAFVAPGARTDMIFIIAQRDARALVGAAFGEEPAPRDASFSPLEAGAAERIIARCAAACEAVGGAPRRPLSTVDARAIAAPAGLCDVRVSAPVRLTIGVGIARPAPEPQPHPTLSPGTLGAIGLDVRAVLGRVGIDGRRLLELRAGDVLRLDTKVAGDGELNLDGQRIARGTCGVVDGRLAFDVHSIHLRGDAP